MNKKSENKKTKNKNIDSKLDKKTTGELKKMGKLGKLIEKIKPK